MTLAALRRKQRAAGEARRQQAELASAIDKHDGTTTVAAAFRAAHRVQPGGRK